MAREHIQVDTNAAGKQVTSWWCCCRCDKELFDGRDIADGLRYRCRRQVSEWEAERLRVRAREADRRLWRRDHPSKVVTPSGRSAPAPNRVGQVFPQAEQTDTELSPFSGSVVPAWSQRSIRSVAVSRSMWIVNPALRSGWGRTDDADST